VRAVPWLSRGLAEAHVLALERLLGEEPDEEWKRNIAQTLAYLEQFESLVDIRRPAWTVLILLASWIALGYGLFRTLFQELKVVKQAKV